jgi:N-methylhydantoinase A/oxoprolinase/acetone carboxylase beta subunit
VGGVRTNFRMPDVFSIGAGRRHPVTGEGDGLKVGPQSVGYRLTEEALVFGGSTLTATDVAVALGLVQIGDKSAGRRTSPGADLAAPRRGSTRW